MYKASFHFLSILRGDTKELNARGSAFGCFAASGKTAHTQGRNLGRGCIQEQVKSYTRKCGGIED